MALHRFDRQVFVALEASASGTLATVSATDFIDAIDPTFTITPRSYERNLVRPSFTPHPQYYPSLDVATGSSDTIAQVEMSFSVEMAAHSSGNTTEPVWGRLLKSCGFEALSTVARVTVGAISSGPILHREEFEISTTPCGRAVGTTFNGDTSLFFERSDTANGSLEATVSGATCTGSSEDTDVGHAYILNTDKTSATASTSVSIWMYLDGQMVVAKGCRGNVEFSFNATDRCLMNFTFTGVLDRYDNSETSLAGASGGNKVPPVFSGAAFGINSVDSAPALNTSAIFSTLSIDMGNELIYRDDANAADGVKEVSIAGRAPTMTFNPDADLAGSGAYANWLGDFVTGKLARAEFRLGAAAEDGNSFLFKMPALQWTGVADGDRDNLTVYEGSANLTGGDNGDSCRSSSDGTTRRYSDRGEDNELVIIAY